MEPRDLDLRNLAGRSPAVLCLAPPDPSWEPLAALCREVGLRAHLVHGTEEAFSRFFEEGGHEALLLLGPGDPETDRAFFALKEIDPALPVHRLAELPRLGFLRSLARELGAGDGPSRPPVPPLEER